MMGFNRGSIGDYSMDGGAMYYKARNARNDLVFQRMNRSTSEVIAKVLRTKENYNLMPINIHRGVAENSRLFDGFLLLLV